MPCKSSSTSPPKPSIGQMRISAQENLVPGASLQEKFELLADLGYNGVEVRAKGSFAFRERLPELNAAVKDGVVISSACIEMSNFIGDFDAERRADAIDNLRSQLEVVGELGGVGVVAPASYGMFSCRLPPYIPPRSPEDDRRLLLDALSQLGPVANSAGTALLFEPLNRYEDYMVNTLGQGAELIEAAGCGGLKLCADFYHLNIEEDDPVRSVVRFAGHVGHVHLSDSNRHQPGAGHVDWRGTMAALTSVGYSGWMVLECRPRPDAMVALRQCIETVTEACLAQAV